jgi:hypothetical protein
MKIDHTIDFGMAFMIMMYGVFSAFRRQFEMGLGHGWSRRANPPIVIKLTGKRAICFGVFSVVSALIVISPLIYNISIDNVSFFEQGWQKLFDIIGILLCACSFIILAFLEYLRVLVSDNIEETK